MQLFVLTRQQHSLLNGHGVLPRPLLHLLVHLVDLGRVHGPQASLSLVCAGCGRLLDLLEAFIQTQVVADRVLPARGRGLEVWKMLAAKKTEETIKINFK
jgi:hypothetical protein